MPPYIQPNYWGFYFEGRRHKLLKSDDVDVDQVVKTILDGSDESPAEAICLACEQAAAPLAVGKVKRRWLEAHAEQIKEAGGDQEAAYRAWTRGRIDELAGALEQDVLDAIEEDACGAEDEGDDEEGDADEEDD